MKRTKNNFKPHKRYLLSGIASVFIVTGALFAAGNTLQYIKSNAVYHSQVTDWAAPEKPLLLPVQQEVHPFMIHIPGEKLYHTRPEPGDQFGELYIPVLKKTLPVYEGTDQEELDQGVGHFTESVLPGEGDNSVLSGHRDTVFQRLGEVKIGDKLIVRTDAGEFEYKIYKIRIVDKDDKTVIVPKPRATLTLSTCYPFSYLGSAPKRYIVVAYLVSDT